MERTWLKHYPQGIAHDIDPDQYQNLSEVIDTCLTRYASRPAFASMGVSLTYAEIDTRSRALAAYLQSQGMKPGDRLAIMLPNLLQYPIALFAAIRAGLVLVNTNPLYTAREMKHQFKDSGATAIIIAENFAHNLEQILPETDIRTIIVTGVGDQLGGLKGMITNYVVRKVRKMVPAWSLPGSITFNQALKSGAVMSLTRPAVSIGQVAAIQYTGGTTGVSKGAMLSHRNLIANMLQVRAWMGHFVREGEEYLLTPLPMYHIYSFTVNCLCGMMIGACCVLVVNPRDQKALIADMKRYPISIMTGVNTLFNALNNNPEFAKVNFSTWRIVSGGAMAIQQPVADRFKEITGLSLCEGYGMTESSPVITTNPFDGSGRIGTIGIPVPGTLVRIADENDNPLPNGERGEIQAQGPQVMLGYYNRPDETAKTITADGWLKTGDVGIMDEDGYVKIVDRIKDMILVSGFNVYPNEIEEVIASHPKVLEVAAIGVPDPHSTEAVKVFIVKKDPSLTEAEVNAFCHENFTNYKRPRYLEFREELPKTNVGKILRRALRDEVKA
ncbi:MAG: AMP-binding protein [Bacteroidia bacterium]|nr:AMP-binding protein [Bacteroidia bacterium]